MLMDYLPGVCGGMKRLLLLLSFRGLHSSGMSGVRA